jgi:late competence protein required for DNA uptake (superfamily II DNA/RNA helicase)
MKFIEPKKSRLANYNWSETYFKIKKTEPLRCIRCNGTYPQSYKNLIINNKRFCIYCRKQLKFQEVKTNETV